MPANFRAKPSLVEGGGTRRLLGITPRPVSDTLHRLSAVYMSQIEISIGSAKYTGEKS